MKRCSHHGRRICVACAVQTAIFPIEHLMWAKVLGPILGITI